MADIDIERKSSPTWLWWLLGLIVVALVVWIATTGSDVDPADTIAPTAVPGPTDTTVDGDLAALPMEVRTFEEECAVGTGQSGVDMGVEHEYTVACLRQLRDALGAVASGESTADVGVQARLDDYGATVDSLESSAADATVHAGLTREAALAAATAMESMRDALPEPGSTLRAAVDEARSAAEAIQEEPVLLEQRELVHAFFRESGEALRALWSAGDANGI